MSKEPTMRQLIDRAKALSNDPKFFKKIEARMESTKAIDPSAVEHYCKQIDAIRESIVKDIVKAFLDSLEDEATDPPTAA